MQYKNFTGSGAITNNRTHLMGWAINCSVTGVLKLRDGSASGPVVIQFNMANGTNNILEVDELPFNDSIYIEVVSGTFDGTIWVA